MWCLEYWLHLGRALLRKCFFVDTNGWYFNVSMHLRLILLSCSKGRSLVPNAWKLGAPCDDGESVWSIASTYVKESRVSSINQSLQSGVTNSKSLCVDVVLCCLISFLCCGVLLSSRHAEKYVRRGRLDWPEGAASRDSIRAVNKLPRLQVCWAYFYCFMRESWDCRIWPSFLAGWQNYFPHQNIVMEHVDHSAGDLIHLLQGLLRYDPSERLTARDALRHPFFNDDHLRRWRLQFIASVLSWRCDWKCGTMFLLLPNREVERQRWAWVYPVLTFRALCATAVNVVNRVPVLCMIAGVRWGVTLFRAAYWLAQWL